MTNKQEFEQIYQKPGTAIWTLEEPPELLKKLVENGSVKPSKTLDVGCGEGTSAVYLAKRGFNVTGIDFSDRAIEYAKERALKEGVNVNFMAMDVNNLEKLSEKFDFVFEWGLLHHLLPDQIEPYLKKVHNLMNFHGVYLTSSFNMNSEVYGEIGQRHRRTPFGTQLYYYSQSEMEKLFSKDFDIIERKIISLTGKGVSQPGNFFLLRKTK